MDSIEQYFQEDYIIEKNRIKEIEDLMKDVLKTFNICNSNGWPYELDDELDIQDNNFSDHNTDIQSIDKNKEIKKTSKLLPNRFSFSTNTMILFILRKLLSQIDKNSPIIPHIEWDKNITFKDDFEKKFISYYSSIRNSLIEKCKLELNEPSKKAHIVKSETFGWNDPLTLSWMAELIIQDQDAFNEIINDFTSIALQNISEAFNKPQISILDLELDKDPEKNTRRASDHIFPLLRTIHLFKSLIFENNPLELKTCFINEKSDITKITECLKNINKATHEKLFINLSNRINQQISYFVLQNSLFDTAELVLSLEGLILIDHKRKVDENLLTKAFEILKTNQINNLYWRPLKPFVTSPQGDILLPLSIEIANSLLRICIHLEIKKKYFFHEFFSIFENYTKWLLSNVSQCDLIDDLNSDSKIEKYRGWHSEHVQKLNVIHPWETAQVIIYLMNYKSMLQDRIAYKSLKKSGLSCTDKYIKEDGIIGIKPWKTKWEVNEPLLDIQTQYKNIGDEFIQKRIDKSKDAKWSMLLYGPPGTGKSTIAEVLAESLNWKLITITPSDFINHGEADIEGRAKSIFKTLEEQKDCVILFDEIDRLILDRDSTYYSSQSDMFQFMTPSMLVKIKDLRTKEKSIFIVATNYEERIDSAIKRSGRIDLKYLINPPNLIQRKIIIADLLIKTGFKFTDQSIFRNFFTEIENSEKKIFLREIVKGDNNSLLENIAKKTALYTFGELKTLVKLSYNNFTDGMDDRSIFKKLVETFDEQEQPTIKLSTYKSGRMKDELSDENASKFPFNEFLYLVYLQCEVSYDFENEKSFVLKVIGLEKNNNSGKKLESDVIKLQNSFFKL